MRSREANAQALVIKHVATNSPSALSLCANTKVHRVANPVIDVRITVRIDESLGVPENEIGLVDGFV